MKNTFRNIVAKRLTEFIVSKGFKKLETRGDFIDFLREKNEKRELLAIQFLRHGRKRFVLEAGECLPPGVRFGAVCIPFDNVESVGSLEHRIRLQPKKGVHTTSWFRADTIIDILIRRDSTNAVIEKCMELFPQIEDWYLTKQVGANIAEFNLGSRNKVLNLS